MIAQWNAPISDRFSSLCARVFSPAAAILESEKTLGTRLGMGGFGIDRDIRYSIHAELPQLYESRKTHKDESSFFRSCC